MRIAIVGASGNVGQRLVAEAVGRGHEVTAVARDISAVPAGDAIHPVEADVGDPATASLLEGQDAVILWVRFQGLDLDSVLNTIRASGVPRLLVVGGAASLEAEPGVQLIDTPGFPDVIKVEAEPARQGLARLRREEAIDWTFLSPSVFFGPGARTGAFRLGGDALLTAEDGKSHISYEDYAVAMLDEIEQPKHRRARFTVGY